MTQLLLVPWRVHSCLWHHVLCSGALPLPSLLPRLVWQRCSICFLAKCYSSSSCFPHQELESPSYPNQGLESYNFPPENLRNFQILISNSLVLNMEILRPRDGEWPAQDVGPRSLYSQKRPYEGAGEIAPCPESPLFPPLNVCARSNPSVWLWVHFSLWNSSGR